MSGETRECVDCGTRFTPEHRHTARCDGCEWEPEPATLRDGEASDEMGHAARNAAQLRVAREEIEEADRDE